MLFSVLSNICCVPAPFLVIPKSPVFEIVYKYVVWFLACASSLWLQYTCHFVIWEPLSTLLIFVLSGSVRTRWTCSWQREGFVSNCGIFWQIISWSEVYSYFLTKLPSSWKNNGGLEARSYQDGSLHNLPSGTVPLFQSTRIFWGLGYKD